MTDCKSQLVELNDRIDTETENDKKLSKYRRKVEKELNEITKLKAQSTARLQELKKSHQKIKKDISAKAQECGRYSMENSTMEISMDQVQETHQIETTQLNMNFDVQKQNQEKDIKLRAKLQQDRNQLLRDTDQFKQEHQRFMTNTNNRLDEAKRCESDLIAQESIAISKNTAESKRELLVKMQTEVSDLEITFNNMSAEYNAVKKKLTDLRSKKISLEVKIKKATKTIEDINQTKVSQFKYMTK
ncbi:PREDICTED: centrosomal protein of 112 kDa-like [Priapulus caudatus]|uniref:Centrosomal protein of 112 kDa-like n=1 Tax=Priapulus caudatus TaxID=37621 RepID=A0ABM1FA97_PRICU|nr:PREDICTED: centrosomal protein of 112 kDa-like [Priapulus caudatus]